MAGTYAYLRVSTTAQAEKDTSLPEQLQKVQGRAQMDGWEIDQVFEEAGISAAKPFATRPEGKKLFEKLKKGDRLLVPKLDRAFRSARDALTVIDDLKKRGVLLYLLDLGSEPVTGNGISALVVTILAAVAEFERELIQERVKDVKASMRKGGRYLGGSRPFGWDVGKDSILEPRPDEQKAIGYMQKLRAEGQSLRQIATTVHKKHNLKLSHVAVGRILRDEAGADDT